MRDAIASNQADLDATEHFDVLIVGAGISGIGAAYHCAPMRPWVDPENFNPGYLMRSLQLMPKQGDHAPWVFTQDYYVEKDEIPACDLEDDALVYQ